MNAKGRVKEDSSLRGMSYHARRDARRTTHYPHTHGMLQGSKGTLREQSSSA